MECAKINPASNGEKSRNPWQLLIGWRKICLKNHHSAKVELLLEVQKRIATRCLLLCELSKD
jgi:hypothetical protein